MQTRLTPPTPSLTYIKYYVYSILVRHPLIINPPVYHPVTGEQVKITKWRMYSGKELSDELTCSIFVASNLGDTSSMTPIHTNNVGSCSVVFKSTDLGRNGNWEDVYFINVKLHLTGLKIGNRSDNQDLIRVPTEAVTHPDNWLHTSRRTEAVELWVDPVDDILGYYLSLIRLVITDYPHRYVQGPVSIESIEPVYGNLNNTPWEKGDGIYWREADMMLRVTTRTASGWRDKFLTGVREINVTLKSGGS